MATTKDVLRLAMEAGYTQAIIGSQEYQEQIQRDLAKVKEDAKK